MNPIRLTLIASLSILPIITTPTSIAFTQPIAAQTQNRYTGVAKQVDDIAQQITVLINSKNSGNGSGAIVAREGNTYYVLTAAHVVQNPDNYTLVAPDGTQYNIDTSQITLLKEVDLAVVKFIADKTYLVAKLARYNAEDSSWVFVSGYPKSLQKEQRRTAEVPELLPAPRPPQRLLTTGTLWQEDYANFVTKDQNSLGQGGRGLVYTSLSMAGMSGGPVLDSRGYIVGINTASENELEITEGGEIAEISLGFSLGVPVGTFIDLAQKTKIQPQWLQIETSSPSQLNASEIESIRENLGRVSVPDTSATAFDWLNYGNQLWRLGRDAEAVSAFEKAIALKSDFYQAYYGKGLALWYAGKDVEAIAAFEQTTKLNPNFPPAWRYQGYSLRLLKKYDLALAAYNKAVELSPDDFVIQVERGNILRDLNRLDESLAAYNKAIAIQPHSWAYNNRGMAYFGLKDYQKAIADFNIALSLNPNNADAYNNRGATYKNLNEPQKAIADYDRAIAIDPEYAQAYHNRGFAYHDLKEYQKAIADYNQAIVLNPKDYYAYNNRGAAYADLQEYQKAIADYDRAIAIDSNNALAYRNRGAAYIDLQDYQKAIADYDRAIALNPEYVEAYYDRGIVYSNLQDYQKAIADYDRAIALNPNYSEAYNNRGKVYGRLEDYQSAIADFNQSLQIDPNNEQAYYNRGIAYTFLKDYQKAIADFTQALRINPNYAAAYGNRGYIYTQLGDRENAIADSKKAAELFCQQGSPNCQQAQEILRQLQEGGN